MTDSKQQTERTGSESNPPSQTPSSTATTHMKSAQQSDAKPTTVSSASSDVMTDDPSYVTILGGAPRLFRRCSTEELNDVRSEIDPDAYFLTGSDESFNGMRQIEYSLSDSNPLFYPGDEHTGNEMTKRINGVDVIVCPDFDSVKRIKQYEANGTINTETETVVLSNLLSTKINMEDLSTTMEGLNRYTDALSPSELRGSYTHISGELPAGYCQEWGDILVRGCGNETNGAGEFLSLKITPTGVVTTEFIDGSSLGMQSIENVGPKTAERLKENGFETKREVADAGVAELTSISGIGEATAESIQQSATALTENRVVPTSDSAVPGSDPVFIDIETDGLNPTSVWLIGVKDGVGGNYMSFIETDPDVKSGAVEPFMAWFKTNASDRTVMAWNGWGFDFPVLRKHIQKHCPQYSSTWKRASKRDPLRWARDLDNAILPGRTNKLEHVAEALGWEGHDTALSGAEVGRRYRKWMETGDPEHELAWEKHKQYCNDDVRALELIYSKMEDASRIDGEVSDSMNVEEETSQGSLFGSY